MVIPSLAVGRASARIRCRDSPANTHPGIRPVASRETQRPMTRLLRSFGPLVTSFLIGGSMMTTMPIAAFGQSLDPVVEELIEFIKESYAEVGRISSHAPFTGTLDAGETAKVRVHTCSGIEYRVIGMCDGDCADLDLTAYDSSTEILDFDLLTDGFPILDFTPAESGITTLSVDMVSCTGSCDWGVQLFIDDATTPAAPASGDGGAPSDRGRYVGTYRGSGGDTTILRHEGRLMVLFPLSQQQNGATGVLRRTGSTHVFRLESDGSSADRERVRFVLNDAGETTGVFIADREYRRVE